MQALLLILICCIAIANSLEMNLEPRTSKCVYEHLDESEHAEVKYSFSSSSGISAIIFRPDGVVSYEKTETKEGSAAWISSATGEFKLCLSNRGNDLIQVNFSFNTGAEAEDFSTLATEEHLEPIEMEMRRLEMAINDIHADMIRQKIMESKMREISEATNSRVVWYSIFSIVVLLSIGAYQIFYLKTFFKKRKLI